MYGYYQNEKMPYIFDLSLKDYSITVLVGLFEGFSLRFDDWFNNRTYNSGHQNKIVRTEEGTYAAFVYNFNGDLAAEYFHIIKIEDDGSLNTAYDPMSDSTISYGFFFGKLVIAEGVTSIGTSAFKGSDGLTSITIPSTVRSIDVNSFYDCTSLNTINFKGTEDDWNSIDFGSNWNYNTPTNMKINYNYTG